MIRVTIQHLTAELRQRTAASWKERVGPVYSAGALPVGRGGSIHLFP